jgi:hypothetical protein
VAGLLALDVAKEHLKITDTDHDAEVQREADAASLTIVGYLDTAADPNWTTATLPDDVRQAMLLMLGLFDAERGGPGLDARMAGDSAEMTWKAIERLLMRRRPPALA